MKNKVDIKDIVLENHKKNNMEKVSLKKKKLKVDKSFQKKKDSSILSGKKLKKVEK